MKTKTTHARTLSLAAAALLWAAGCWAGDPPSAPQNWWLARNLRVVTYWTGVMVVEKGSQALGTLFWQERFGQRTLAGYFESYLGQALASGADGVFFNSICRLSGLPSKAQEEIAELVKRRFQEMNARSGRPAVPGAPHAHEASSTALLVGCYGGEIGDAGECVPTNDSRMRPFGLRTNEQAAP